jgi:hypothetical protein
MSTPHEKGLALELAVHDVSVPFGFHGIVESTIVELAVIALGADESSDRATVDLTTETLAIGGDTVVLDTYVNEWVNAEWDRRVNSFPSQTAEEGAHDLLLEAERRLEPGTALLRGTASEKLRRRGQVRVHVVRPKIISHFEVAARGRALTVVLDGDRGRRIHESLLREQSRGGGSGSRGIRTQVQATGSAMQEAQ